MTQYHIGGGNYWGKEGPDEHFNNVYVPRLLELGIKPENMGEVAEMFADVYGTGFMNGEDYLHCENDEE